MPPRLPTSQARFFNGISEWHILVHAYGGGADMITIMIVRGPAVRRI